MNVYTDDYGEFYFGNTGKAGCDLCGKAIGTHSKIKFKTGKGSEFDKGTIKFTICNECADMLINYCRNKQKALGEPLREIVDWKETPSGVEAAAKLMVDEMFHDFKYDDSQKTYEDFLAAEGMSKEDFLNFFIRDLRYVLGMGYPDDEECTHEE